ncbi:DEAD/DEAH box helicase [Desulfatirhabdium butyrativorans]|uniref:DEAD/DEAH box helicase n=1 Tax=Desulfatirhabdium butyrativorans TaxID=340467 RepID=UPI0004282D67|nr:DEAD/DEAH box helicase [Desulfatirhabdium butyrativorans]
MKHESGITEYIQALKRSDALGDQVIYNQILPASSPKTQKLRHRLAAPVRQLLVAAKIPALYAHQAEAIDAVLDGRHVVVATPTASGKTLTYHIPFLQRMAEEPEATSLYVFPLKALAHDQMRVISELSPAGSVLRPTVETYDGDTTSPKRKMIRDNPPNILLTNPEMIHLSLLPYHHLWKTFFSRLRLIVIDEVHTYRGILGSHMAWVIRRLLRVAGHYAVSPTIVCCSATVDNPAAFCSRLTAQDMVAITDSGAGQGNRHLIFLDPVAGMSQTAILLMKAALHRGLRTIVYAQSREMTERIAMWASQRSGSFRNRISAYRAGFLPEERREIEAKLCSGELLAVVSTSALELGIDIGYLDLCILVGYPGTVVSMWQRAGRVGRSGQDSALILIGGDNALDQYFLRNPRDLLDRRPETAVVNPLNPVILEKHLLCAAAELDIRTQEPLCQTPQISQSLLALEADGRLLKSSDGNSWTTGQRNPQRDVDLRGTGKNYLIRNEQRVIGTIDGFRVFREAHPGAIYTHRGRTYVVDRLDLENQDVWVEEKNLGYYTRPHTHKETDILSVDGEQTQKGIHAFRGRLRVTDQVVGYEKWRHSPHRKIQVLSLDMPPLTFETEGLWIALPNAIREATEKQFLHFMGGIHAIEHATIGLFPLLVMTDRNDLGGISTTLHPHVGEAAIFVYDAVPGGAGLTAEAFERIEELVGYVYKQIKSCPCNNGCPSCVHSPKCGSGNRPIDKAAACFILRKLLEAPSKKTILRKKKVESATASRPAVQEERVNSSATPQHPEPAVAPAPSGAPSPAGSPGKDTKPATPQSLSMGHYGVLDIETQMSAEEAGGWNRADRMKVSCAVLYDSQTDRYDAYLEDRIDELLERLKTFDLMVGFNIKRFDYQVLRGYGKFDFQQIPTLDILESVHGFLGYRLSLDHLAHITLGKAKSGDGLQALRWWKEGRIAEIIEYCRMDVAITRDLFLFGLQNGYLLFENKAKKTVRIPVKWQNALNGTP